MKKGNVLLGVVLLLSALLTIGIALSSAVLSTNIKVKRTYHRLAALSYAEGGVNRALWEINKNGSYATTLDNSLPGGQFEATVTDCGTNCKQITSIGYVPSKVHYSAKRTIRIKINGVISNSNISFNYGVQVDELGIYADNNSTIKGSVFSNGPIVNAGKNTSITGAATSHGSNFLLSSITSGTIGGDARAFFIINSTVKGTKYAGVNPGYQGMPIPTDQLNTTIDGWEAQAEAGGIINNNAKLEMRGTIWVSGNIYIKNGANVYLNSGYGNNSGILIADYKQDRLNFNQGRIYVNQNSVISGIDPQNPKTPSYIMLFSTQHPQSPFETFWKLWPAITIEQNSVGGVYYSPFGSLAVKQNAQARALASAGLVLEENALVDYDAGMANSNFANGPSGKWTITEWQALD